jgi:hypothetical protein
MKKKIIVGVVLLAIAWVLVGWVQQRRECKLRDAKYRARIARVHGLANERLIPGATREDALKYFRDVGMEPVVEDRGGAMSSTEYMQACSPGWYCGDQALVGVRVLFDETGHVKTKSLGSIYTNCL